MKHDYLWDKTGSDPDIERLEDLLSGFRYTGEAGAGPNVVEFPSKTKRRVQPRVFAMAACAAVAAGALTAWNLSMNIDEPTPVLTAISIEERLNPEAPISYVDKTMSTELEISAPSPQLTSAVKKLGKQPGKKHTAISRKRQERRETPVLTGEEKYAYGQLMLALSITSSKWQVVQESINGVEDAGTNDR